MATSRLREQLTHIVQCPICYSNFSNETARLLNCSHPLCESCIENMMPRHGDNLYTVHCPFCSKPTYLWEGKVSNLPVFFHGNVINDVIRELNQKYSTCLACQSDTHRAQVCTYCFQCSSAMCKACKLSHDEGHKEHTQIVVNASTVGHIICDEHDKHLEAFCLTCIRGICNICKLNVHHKHQIYDGSSGGENISGHVTDVLNERLELTERMIVDIVAEQKEFVSGMMNRLISLRSRSSNWKEKPGEEEYKSACNQIQNKLDEVNDVIDGFKAMNMEVRNYIHRLLGRYKISKKDSVISADLRARKVCALELITNMEESVRKREWLRPFHLFDEVPFERPGEAEGSSVNHSTVGEGNEAESRTPSKDPVLLWKVTSENAIRNIAFLPNGLIIAPTRSAGLQTFNHQGQEMVVSLPLDNKPALRVAVDSLGTTIAVLSPFVCDVERFSDILYFQARMNDWCANSILAPGIVSRLAVTKMGDHILTKVADITRHNTLWPRNESFCISFGTGFFSRLFGLTSVSDVYVDEQERIIACHNESLSVFDRDGKMLFSLTERHPKLRPTHVCVDSRSNIIVADSNSKSITLFDPTGQYVEDLMKTDERIEAMDIYSSQFLALLTNKALCVYKLHYAVK